MKTRNLFFLIGVVLLLLCFLCLSSKGQQSIKSLILKPVKNEIRPKRILPFNEALVYVKMQKMDTGLAIFIHYHQHSGKKRGFIIDLQNKKVKDSFLVSHGCGVNPWGNDYSKDKPAFSNAAESHCSSLGKYKVGKRDYSQWGINVKYYLHGLENTNSNAYKRTIVLHGWNAIPDEECYPVGTAEGWGCPAVSNKTMTVLDSLLSAAKRPVLLWVY